MTDSKHSGVRKTFVAVLSLAASLITLWFFTREVSGEGAVTHRQLDEFLVEFNELERQKTPESLVATLPGIEIDLVKANGGEFSHQYLVDRIEEMSWAWWRERQMFLLASAYMLHLDESGGSSDEDRRKVQSLADRVLGTLDEALDGASSDRERERIANHIHQAQWIADRVAPGRLDHLKEFLRKKLHTED